MSQLAIPAFVLDANGEVQVWNAACERLTGVKADEVIGTRNHWQAFYSEERDCLADLVVKGKSCELENLYTSHKDDCEFGYHAENWCEMPNIPGDSYLAIDAGAIHNDEGELIFVIQTIRDITEQRVAQENLSLLYLVSSILVNVEHPLEEIFNTIVSTVTHSMQNTDSDETYTRIVFDEKCYPKKDLKEAQISVSSPINVNGLQRGRIEILCLAGSELSDKDLFGNDKEHLITAISYDISSSIERRLNLEERQNIEVQLRQAQKLESVGQLAAGIAHEINTPTQFVNDNTHFLQDAYTDYSKLLETHERIAVAAADGPVPASLLDELKSQVEELDIDYLKKEIPLAIKQSMVGLERIAKIVKAMKEFSHPGSAEKTLYDINRAIETTVDVSRNEWRYTAELIKDFDSALPQVPILIGEFNQVILNLIVNAAHAISDVSTGENSMGEIRIATRSEKNWVVVEVSDNGSGISEENRKRIFDPFFTTKEVGKGTGQGLAIAWSVIVDKHGGTFGVESEKGKGTSFIIRLPIGQEIISD